MREIKFRAWDESRSRMLIAGEDKVTNLWLMSFHKDRLMQFTGIKDKNGVDIYEGDIVKGYLNVHGSKGIGVVIFNNGSFMVKLGKDTFGSWVYDELEIIGNIHTNPEMI